MLGSTIEWRDVVLRYPDCTVLANVGGVARAGEILAITGPNGAGKTTLLNVALGLVIPTSGAFLIGDCDLQRVDRKAWRRHVQFLAQRPYLLPRRNVRAAMQFPFDDIDEDAMRTALERVGLWERLMLRSAEPLRVLTDTLSAGERQRLAIARLLTRDADVYLLDEPDANLDAQGLTTLLSIMAELAHAGKIVCVAAHAPEVIAVATRVLDLAGRPTDARRVPVTRAEHGVLLV